MNEVEEVCETSGRTWVRALSSRADGFQSLFLLDSLLIRRLSRMRYGWGYFGHRGGICRLNVDDTGYELDAVEDAEKKEECR